MSEEFHPPLSLFIPLYCASIFWMFSVSLVLLEDLLQHCEAHVAHRMARLVPVVILQTVGVEL